MSNREMLLAIDLHEDFADEEHITTTMTVIDMNLKELMGTMRLPFLILAPVCVLLGIGTAYWSTGQINVLYAILALIGGVAAHVSVNVFNEYTGTAFMASLVPFFLVSDLLLLNQFPDVDADRTVGRLHFPIVIGRKNSSLIYAAFLAAAYLSI